MGGVSTGGGGGGGGGGYRMFRGDMELEIEKLVSLDGTNYRDASSEALAIVIPENQVTRLYNKVRVKNLGEVSAKNVKYTHFFDSGESDMTAGDMHDVKGAVLDNDNNVLISKIKVNETFEFSYSILITESGQNSNSAIDGLELLDFGSTVLNAYDQLDYLGIGDQFVSYIYAGDVPAPQFIPSCGDSFNNSDILTIRVDSDKTQVGIGETVNYTITIENVSDVDLTNIYLTHSYPAELSIDNTGGAVNSGRELQWKRAILRSGQTASYRFIAKVIAGAPGSQIRSLTRALVSEFENIPPAESCLTITGGAAPGYSLVQTGPGLLMSFILTILTYLGYRAYQRRRYIKLKEAALRF